MPFKIVRNDLTKMQVDVIVNTANEAPIYSTGTDTAVYKAAGEEELLAERKKIGYMEEGEVAITPGFKLPAKYIIHAVSPWYIDGNSGEEERLRSCYKNSLRLAAEHDCKSIAFPLISTGTFLMRHEMLVYLVVFDTKATELGFKLYPELEAYIDHHYVCQKREEEYGDRYFGSIRKEDPQYDGYQIQRKKLEEKLRRPIINLQGTVPLSSKSSYRNDVDEVFEASVAWEGTDVSAFLEENEFALEERMNHMEDTFQEYLMYLISVKKLTNSEVYKRAIVTKQLFSKIKLNPEYHPDKATAMRLCVGARLNLDETNDLLARAGYALSPCDKRDIIFSFFIEHQVFDMIEIDIALEEHNLPCFIS